MKKAKLTLSHFNAEALNRNTMTYIKGGNTTVPPQGDPGDTNDPTAPQPPPPPRRPGIDPDPADPINP